MFYIQKLAAEARENAEDQVVTLWVKIAVQAEEERLHRKYGYTIPRSIEKLSKDDYEGLQREFMIRDAMTRYLRVAVGEE